MTQKAQNTKIFINPSGFIEQHYSGVLEPDEILESLKQLRRFSRKLQDNNQPILILGDVSKLKKMEFMSSKMAEVRKAAAATVKDIEFERGAVYGSLRVQVIVSALALVAGKRDKIRVFDNRISAIKWLLSKK
jgi:hypothetical protein